MPWRFFCSLAAGSRGGSCGQSTFDAASATCTAARPAEATAFATELVRPTDPAALVLAKSPEISDVFDSRLRPFGFVPEDLDRSRLLWYFVMRSAWQQRPETEPGTGVDPAATDRDAGTGVD